MKGQAKVEALLVIVIGEAPSTLKEEQETEPEQETEVVATELRAAVPLPYRSWPAVKEVWPVPPRETASDPIQ